MTTQEIRDALDQYRVGMADAIHGMADNRGLDSLNLTADQYKALIIEEAEWCEKHATHPVVVGTDEATTETRHAQAMRDIAAKI